MGKCYHREREYKIKQLYPSFEFPLKLAFYSVCKGCGEILLKLQYKRDDGTEWNRKYYGEEADNKLADLRVEFVGDYKLDTHPELDLAPTYYDGKDHSIRKLSPGDPEVEKWYSPQEILAALLTIAKFKSISYISYNIDNDTP